MSFQKEILLGFKIAVPLLIFNEELVQLVPQDPGWNQIGTEPATFAFLTASSVANQNRNHPSVCMFLHHFPAVVAVWKASHMQFVTSLLQFEGETYLRGASGYSGELAIFGYRSSTTAKERKCVWLAPCGYDWLRRCYRNYFHICGFAR